MSSRISIEDKNRFEEDGFLIIRDLLTPDETRDLQLWAQEVHDWPNDETSPWMAYAEINANGDQVLCRTENYAASHEGMNSLLRGPKLRNTLYDLSGEEMVLFKEKINYKLPSSGGFAPHIDSVRLAFAID
jgi:2-aminoethylphosphonate dioxygenase